jgi:peptidoglycan biosynthesis protein MviN/MurJ (putative lipid II flippase)
LGIDQGVLGTGRNVARSSAIISVSALVGFALGAAQSLLLVAVVGHVEATDAFLAAYSLYLPLALIAASLRSSLVSLFGAWQTSDEFHDQATKLLSKAIATGGLLSLGLIVVAPIAGPLVTRGLSLGSQFTAVAGLALLAPAAYLQFHAASASAVLIAAKRYSATAIIYLVSAWLALLSTAAFLRLFGVLGASFGILSGAAFLAVAHAVYLSRRGLTAQYDFAWLASGQERKFLWHLLAGAAIPVSWQVSLAISLSAISSSPGAITVYSYAYFIASVMLNLSVVPGGLVRLADAVRDISRDAIAGSEEYVVGLCSYVLVTLTPMLLAFALYGLPLTEALFGRWLGEDALLVYQLALILGGHAISAALIYVANTALLTKRRFSQLVIGSALNVTTQFILVLAFAQGDPVRCAWLQVASTTASAVLMLTVAFGSSWPRWLLRALRRAASRLILCIAFPIMRQPLGANPSAVVAGATLLLAVAIYGLLAILSGQNIRGLLLSRLRR